MSEPRRTNEFSKTVTARPVRWLPALERELKLRTGWTAEIVSPFNRARTTERPKRATRRVKRP